MTHSETPLYWAEIRGPPQGVRLLVQFRVNGREPTRLNQEGVKSGEAGRYLHVLARNLAGQAAISGNSENIYSMRALRLLTPSRYSNLHEFYGDVYFLTAVEKYHQRDQ
jgi:hypothetical protein